MIWILAGQASSHLAHIVHFHGQLEATSSSSMPSTAIRTIFRGSRPSTPDIGQALAQVPQVMQASAQDGSTASWLFTPLMTSGS